MLRLQTLKERAKQYEFRGAKKYKNILIIIATPIISLIYSLYIYKDNIFQIVHNSIPLSEDGALTGLFIDAINRSSYFEVLTLNLREPNLGWPSQLHYSLFPAGSTFDIVVMKAISQILNLSESGQFIHFFAITKSVIISLTSLYFFRVLELNYKIASVLSIIFATSNFNLVRSEGHFFLGLTWAIPLGLGALILAAKLNLNSRVPYRRHYFQLISIGIVTGLSSFYFALIILIITMLFFLSDLITNFPQNQLNTKKFNLKILHQKSSMLVYLVSIISGLMYQVTSIFLANRNILNLYNVGQRSPIESIVYSGNLESLFFDSSKLFLLMIKRFDFVDFLASRVTWEATQTSALTGIVLYFLAIFFASKLSGFSKFNRYFKNEKANLVKIATLMLVLVLALYLASPLNFAISRLASPIRAWGRLSIFLTLLALAILGLVVSNMKSRSISILLLTLAMLISYSEANLYRNSRMDSAKVTLLTKELRSPYISISSDLMNKYEKSCSAMYLPISPFPEFDYPNDKVGIYEPLLLIRETLPYFKWSYGGVKNTETSNIYQNWALDYPNFSRISLNTGIQTGKQLGFCFTVIDLEMLNINENNYLNSLKEKIPKDCLTEYYINKESAEPKYVVLDNSRDNCFKIESRNKIAAKMKSQDMIYKITSANDAKFIGEFLTVPSTSDIGIRIMQKKKTGLTKDSKLKLNIIIKSHRSSKILESNAKLCIISEMRNSTCNKIEIKSSDIYYLIEFKDIDILDKPNNYLIQLNIPNQTSYRWGIQVI